jgi:simple sugar transport system ATP-binding protein
VAIIFISHNLTDIFDVSDRILVLERGRKAGERLIGDTNEDEVVAMMMGRVLDD